MQCHQTQKLLSAYVDGMLSPSEKQELEAHLEKCSACKSELDFLKNVLRTVHNLPPVKPPAGFRQSLKKKLSGAIIMQEDKFAGAYKNKSVITRWSGIIGIAAGFLLVIGIAAAGIDLPFTQNIETSKKSDVVGQQTQNTASMPGNSSSNLSSDIMDNNASDDSDSKDIIVFRADDERGDGIGSGPHKENISESNNMLPLREETSLQPLARTAPQDAGVEMMGQVSASDEKQAKQMVVEIRVEDKYRTVGEISSVLLSMGANSLKPFDGVELVMSLAESNLDQALDSIYDKGIIISRQQVSENIPKSSENNNQASTMSGGTERIDGEVMMSTDSKDASTNGDIIKIKILLE